VATSLIARSPRVLRYSAWDAVLIGLSFAYAGLLLSTPSIPLIAIGLWWTANTVAHNFIHTPYFHARVLNRAYSMFLTALMGIPQRLWRDRHLRHHRALHGDGPANRIDRQSTAPNVAWTRTRFTSDVAAETAVVLLLWLGIAAVDPAFFLGVYVPGYLTGLGLCSLQGHFEHARGTTSHYGWLYNRCFFNDGYHAEHHLRPGEHWTRLPSRPRADARASRWPPVLRWLDAFSLESLERRVLRSPRLQRFVLASHERAFRALLPRLQAVHRVTIVGGGLFPRSALILHRLLPDATLTIVDAKREHLEIASMFLSDGIELQHRMFDPAVLDPADLVVIPLAFIGDRERVYLHPPAKATMVHDWLWKPRGGGVRVSCLLLKRLNLVTR
jgi:fatty acid desaturase